MPVFAPPIAREILKVLVRSSEWRIKRTKTYHNQQVLTKCGVMSVINAFLCEAEFGNRFDIVIDRRLSLVPVSQFVFADYTVHVTKIKTMAWKQS